MDVASDMWCFFLLTAAAALAKSLLSHDVIDTSRDSNLQTQCALIEIASIVQTALVYCIHTNVDKGHSQ